MNRDVLQEANQHPRMKAHGEGQRQSKLPLEHGSHVWHIKSKTFS